MASATGSAPKASLESVLSTTFQGRSIRATVVRKRVKNLNLRIHADGTVTMSIPMRTSISRAQDFLDRKAPWIARRLDGLEALQAQQGAAFIDQKHPAAHQKLVLWGEAVDAGPVLAAHGLLPAKGHADPGENAHLVEKLYRQEVARVLPDIARPLETAMGVSANRWQVRSMKTRWGSCTPKTAAIRINAQLAAYPIDCLSFVVAHELVHLMEPSHNARFHMLLDVYCPRNRELAARLKKPPANPTP